MEIKKDTVVSIDYTLKNDAGEVVDTSEGRAPLDYLHGHGNIIPGLENALTGRKIGDSLKVTIPPAEGYGEVDKSLLHVIPRRRFPPGQDLEPGMMFQARLDDGPQRVYRIDEVGAEEVRVDGNHPLAGQNLNFEVAVKEVRAATATEIAHGHVHPGGHDHD